MCTSANVAEHNVAIQQKVRVRVTGSGPTKGVPVLCAARQRGLSSRVGDHRGNVTAHRPEPHHMIQHGFKTAGEPTGGWSQEV
eukprot:300571-Chlamydomonas_euryale.AAC.19